MGQETLKICSPLNSHIPTLDWLLAFMVILCVCAMLLRSNATKRIHVEYPWKPSGVHVLHGSVCG